VRADPQSRPDPGHALARPEDRRSFDKPELALVQAAADQIGLALDNARLYSESRRQLDELGARTRS
jgi:GAF domain-containing protein